MKQLRDILNKTLNALVGISFLAMVLLTCWQVLTRYVMKNPSTWSEELVSYLFAWMSLLGASIVVSERGHMNIPIVVERMNPKVRKGFDIFSEIIAFLFAAIILIYGGMQISELAMGQMTSSLRVAVGVFYIVLPLSGVLNMLYAILNIWDILKDNTRLAIDEEINKEG